MSDKLCSKVLPKPIPGSIQNLGSLLAANKMVFSSMNAFTSATTSSYVGESCMVLGEPFACIRT